MKAQAVTTLALSIARLAAGKETGDKWIEESLDDATPEAQIGTIRLYPAATRVRYADDENRCPEGKEPATLNVPIDVCVSGQQYVHNNVNIEKAPVCPNGKEALMFFYPNRRCSNIDKWRARAPEGCFWADSYYWSFVFRCSPYSSKVSVDGHLEAEAPFNPFDDPGQSNGTIIGHFFDGCRGHRSGGHRELSVPPNKCLTTPGYGMQILKPATCPDGTRARYARFPDKHCSDGEVTAENGLVDLHDADIGKHKCHDTGDVLQVGDDRGVFMRSMMFWCDASQLSKAKEPEQEPESELKLAEEESEEPLPDDDSDDEQDKPREQKGSIGQLLLIIFLIILFIILGAVLAVLRWASVLQNITAIFNRQDGGIRL